MSLRPLRASLIALALWPGAAVAGELRVAVLAYGTVNWELDVIQHHGLAAAEGVELSVIGLGSPNATSVALHAGEADMMVSDWIWVSRQRAAGDDYAFAPYSVAVGGLMVPADSPVEGLADLAGRRVGIAGGPLDKSWILMRALAERDAGLDLEAAAEPVFGAPPLLNQQILSGGIDAVLNYWHYNARLEAAGLRTVVEVEDAAAALGIDPGVPLLGYVFDAGWAAAHREDVLGFLRASRRAKEILSESDAEWERLRPLMNAPDDATFAALVRGWRAGIPEAWGDAERAAAGTLFDVLARIGGAALVGPSETLEPGTFWAPWRF